MHYIFNNLIFIHIGILNIAWKLKKYYRKKKERLIIIMVKRELLQKTHTVHMLEMYAYK